MLRDERVRLAAALTVIMMAVILVVAGRFEAEKRLPLMVGLVVVMALLQMTILLRGGPPRSALALARRDYLNGNFEAAANLLESCFAHDSSPGAEALALLGNTYRQLGQLELSETRLRQAIAREPENHMALYGLGRTLLARGCYPEAAEYIEAALKNGARRAVEADLALALYYASADPNRLLAVARRAGRLLNLEDYRALMLNYLLYNLLQDERTVARRIMQNTVTGLGYWQAQARRFAETDYGRRVAADVVAIKALLNGEQAADE